MSSAFFVLFILTVCTDFMSLRRVSAPFPVIGNHFLIMSRCSVFNLVCLSIYCLQKLCPIIVNVHCGSLVPLLVIMTFCLRPCIYVFMFLIMNKLGWCWPLPGTLTKISGLPPGLPLLKHIHLRPASRKCMLQLMIVKLLHFATYCTKVVTYVSH